MKMSPTEFSSKCEKLANNLSALGMLRAAHGPIYKSGLTLYAYINGHFGLEDTFYVLNTDDGVVYTRHIDLDVKLKSSNAFLEVADV